MNILKIFPSKYVTAGDLGDRRVKLRMGIVKLEKLGNPPEEKPVLYFQSATKGLILNRTNAMAIAAAYGPETGEWTGKEVTLYVTRMKAFGKMQDVLRVEVERSGLPETLAGEMDDPEDVTDEGDPDPELWVKH